MSFSLCGNRGLATDQESCRSELPERRVDAKGTEVYEFGERRDCSGCVENITSDTGVKVAGERKGYTLYLKKMHLN